jgi:ATP-dependent helicase/nuclease subunit B
MHIDHAPSRLLADLERLTSEQPRRRKRLVSPDLNFGRELLTALARRTGGWIGWEATTVRTIADSLAFVPLAAQDRRAANDVELGELVSAAFDQCRAEGLLLAGFETLGHSLGFRVALRDAVLELRTAGVSAEQLLQVAPRGSAAAELAAVLRSYVALLQTRALVDPAGVFQAALDAFDDEAPYVLDGITALVPTLTLRGLPGQLVARLVARGAVVLQCDIGPGADCTRTLLSHCADAGASSTLAWACGTTMPDATADAHDTSLATVDMFAAVTPSDELREVCRRVIAEGRRWDEVEIAATDPDVYGVALDALCQQTGIAATMLRGVPLAQTRLGRALEHWFEWLSDGLSADLLRESLESGALASPNEAIPVTVLARELRTLRIGWGRACYETAIASLRQREPGADDAAAGVDQPASATARVLADLLQALLELAVDAPERDSHAAVLTSTAALAGVTLQYTAMMRTDGERDTITLQRLQQRLRSLAALEPRSTDFTSALAVLREALSDVRAWTSVSPLRQPFSATGGALHLTDIAHAGATARPRIFVVGLDADRASGPARQDALLPDTTRRSIAGDCLPTVHDRRSAWAVTLSTALSALRGAVTLSYAIRTSADDREASPAPLMLQAMRIISNTPALTYAALRERLLPPACAMPTQDVAAGAGLLDARDVWLNAIASGELLQDASVQLGAAFPALATGLAAAAAFGHESPSAFHGIVPAEHSPLRANALATVPLSASSLERLSRCGLSWLYHYGLELRVPDDPEYDPDSWLDASQRGALLHSVFEQFVQLYRSDRLAIAAPDAQVAIRNITERQLAQFVVLIPPPGTSAYRAESAEIHRAALAFLQMERDALAIGDAGVWLQTEFALRDGARSARYRLTDDRVIALTGRVDRVDQFADGRLRIIDYKTGSPSRFRPSSRNAAFNGARLLQPALYADAVSEVLKTQVTHFEYRFPTDRGQNVIIAFSADELAPLRSVVTALLDGALAGEFLPTTDAADCAFCEHSPICRVRNARYSTVSPRASWAEANAASIPAYVPMLTRRDRKGGGP